jgi:hypothetical protein
MSNIIVVFELKTGKLVKSEVTEQEFNRLESGQGLTKDYWYEGTPLAGSWSEYSCFKGNQIVNWKIYLA